MTAGPLKVLVLEDFHITALNGWSCQGDEMSSSGAVERWLRGKIAVEEWCSRSEIDRNPLKSHVLGPISRRFRPGGFHERTAL